MRGTLIKSAMCVMALAVTTAVTATSQQLGDLSGRRLIMNDGGTAGTTKNTLTIEPANAATQTTSYTLIMPGPVPAANAVLQVASIAGTTATLQWVVAPSINIPLVFEEETGGQGNIRRRSPFTSLVATPVGQYAFDAQGSRALATQTAAGPFSAILGGANNTAQNQYSLVLGGQSNTAQGDYSVILGGQSLTMTGSNSLGYSTGGALSTTSANTFLLGNTSIHLANNNNTPSQLRFYEANATTGAFPPAGTNFIGFRAGTMANDNIYTLPSVVGTVNQVLKINAVAGNDATVEWANDFGGPVVQANNINADNTNIVVGAGVTVLRLTSDGLPANRTITMTAGAGMVDGQLLIIRVVGTVAANGVEILDAAGYLLSGNFQGNTNDTITLMWDAPTTSWIEVARRAN